MTFQSSLYNGSVNLDLLQITYTNWHLFFFPPNKKSNTGFLAVTTIIINVV